MINVNKNVTVICDLQFGSTGKGLIAGYIAERDAPDTVVTAWSANAGHTYIDAKGKKYVHCMLANGIVSPGLKRVLIGPGSQLDLNGLFNEVITNKKLLGDTPIFIHENACVIQERHREEEAGPMTKIGSTKKGCGAAMIEKIRRSPDTRIIAKDFQSEIMSMAEANGVHVQVVAGDRYAMELDKGSKVLVEGAQGYSLGLNNGFYPYVTSRECTPAQILSDCAVPIARLDKVIGTMRTYPIRVANRYDQDGNMIGWSGPSYAGQREVSFEEIGQKTEFTTVTKLPRRIFEFSRQQTRDALRMVMPDEIFLNFVNYVDIDKFTQIMDIIDESANEFGCGSVRYFGCGPTKTDVRDGDVPVDVFV